MEETQTNLQLSESLHSVYVELMHSNQETVRKRHPDELGKGQLSSGSSVANWDASLTRCEDSSVHREDHSVLPSVNPQPAQLHSDHRENPMRDSEKHSEIHDNAQAQGNSSHPRRLKLRLAQARQTGRRPRARDGPWYGVRVTKTQRAEGGWFSQPGSRCPLTPLPQS